MSTKHTPPNQQTPPPATMTAAPANNTQSGTGSNYGAGYNNNVIQNPPSAALTSPPASNSAVKPLTPDEIISEAIGQGKGVVDFFLKATTNKTDLVEQLWQISKQQGKPIKKKDIQKHLDQLQDYLKSSGQKTDLRKISSALKYLGYAMVASDIMKAVSASKGILSNPELSAEEKAEAIYRNLGNVAIDFFLPPVRIYELLTGDPILRENMFNLGKNIGDTVGGAMDNMWASILKGSKFEKLLKDNKQGILNFINDPVGVIKAYINGFVSSSQNSNQPSALVGAGAVAPPPAVQSKLTPSTPANVYTPRQCVDPKVPSPYASNKGITEDLIATIKTYKPRQL